MTGPILLCDDGSRPAAEAIRAASTLLSDREAIALHVWQPLTTGYLAAATAGMLPLPPDADDKLAAAAATAAERAADRARQAGFRAVPLAVEVIGPVWQAILDMARTHDVSVIVLGARGLSGVQHALVGSVSERVVRHADRPVLVLHATDAGNEHAATDAAA